MRARARARNGGTCAEPVLLICAHARSIKCFLVSGAKELFFRDQNALLCVFVVGAYILSYVG